MYCRLVFSQLAHGSPRTAMRQLCLSRLQKSQGRSFLARFCRKLKYAHESFTSPL